MLDQNAIDRLKREQARFEKLLHVADVQTEELAEAKRQLEVERAGQAELRQRVEQEYGKKEKAVQATVRRLREQNDELTRRVERLSAGDRGEFNEDDIYAQLQAAFPDDSITQAQRGQRGADVFQQVRVRTADGLDDAGLIVYECKDVLKWSNAFVGQAKAAGIANRTPFVVLISRVFPRNESELMVIDGVIVVDPARCVALADVVRRMVIEIHRSGSMAGSQTHKTEALFEYISSTEFKQCFTSMSDTADELTDLLAKERRSHQRMWTQREHAYRELGDTLVQIDTSFQSILQKNPNRRGMHPRLTGTTGR